MSPRARHVLRLRSWLESHDAYYLLAHPNTPIGVMACRLREDAAYLIGFMA